MNAVAASVQEFGSEVIVEKLDLSDSDAVHDFVAYISQRARPLILVNNGGESFPDALAEVNIDDAERHFRINSLGALALTRGLSMALASHASVSARS